MHFLRLLLSIAFSTRVLGKSPLLHSPRAIPSTDEETGYRISNLTFPLRYDIHLTTNIHLGETEFSGEALIRLKVLSETNFIQLHYREIQFEDFELSDAEGRKIEIKEWTLDAEKEFLNVFLNDDELLMEFEEYVLRIEYRNTLRSDSRGFHRSSYVNEGGETRWLATTHFEATSARHAFPCYDEPGIRAAFGVRITHHETYMAISNMPGSVEGEPLDGMVTTVFEDTPRVQSYLIAFVVSDFHYLEDPDNHQRVFARPEAILNGEADLALYAGVRILDDLEEYLETSYDLPKLDQAAIPEFRPGAMENWGMVLYREPFLLYKESRDSLDDRMRILTTIAHEDSHQFFGNRVAPKWWSYLWLNEGFATLFEFLTTDRVFPELRAKDLFVVGTLQSAFVTDSNPKISHPMTYYLESHGAVQTLFDSIAYGKSGSVLRMFLHAFSEKTFRKGLKYYLKWMRLQAADSDDLAVYLEQAAEEDKTLPSGVEMRTIVDSWSRKRGYPVVNVERMEDETLRLTHERFWSDSTTDPGMDRWWIPINLATESSPDFEDTFPVDWIKEEDVAVIYQTDKVKWNESDWIVLNKQQTGYYRVNYDRKGWELIIRKLSESSRTDIHVLNRAQLVDDIFSLAYSGRQSYDLAFDLVLTLHREEDYTPWAAADRAFTTLNRMLELTEGHELFQLLVRDITRSVYHGIDQTLNDDLFDRYFWNVLIKWTCRSGNEDCLYDTDKRLRKALEDPQNDVEPELKAAIYCNGLRRFNNTDWHLVWDKLSISTDQTERSILISALACSENPDILRSYLLTSIDETVSFTSQERNSVFTAVSSSGASGVEISIDFIDENFIKIEELYNGPEATVSAVRQLSSLIVGVETYSKFDSLLAKLVEESITTEDLREELLRDAKQNLDWARNNEREIFEYLEEWFEWTKTSGAELWSFSILLCLSMVTIVLMW